MALRELIASFGIEVDDKDVEKASKSVNDLYEKLSKIVQGAVAVKFATTFYTWVDSLRVAGDELDKTSQKVGVNTRALQQWRYAGELAGLASNQIDTALVSIQKNAVNAARGEALMQEAFRKFGVSVKDAAGNLKGPEVLLEELADGLGNVSTGTERTALLMRILEESGKDLFPLLNQGSGAIRAARQEFEDLGGAISQDVIKQTTELTDNQTRLAASFSGVRNTVAVVLLPIINRVVTGLTSFIAKARELTKGTKIVQTALIALGAILVGIGIKVTAAFAGPLLTVGLFAAAITATVLVVEDLYQLFTGGKSIIGEWIDELLGVGTAADVVEKVRDGFEEVVWFIKEAWQWTKDFFNLLNIGRKAEKDAFDAVLGPTKFDKRLLRKGRNGREAPYDFEPGQAPLISSLPQGRGALLSPGTVTRENPVTNNSSVVQNVAPVTNTTVNVNAASANAQEVVKLVQKEIKTAKDRDLRNAYSALIPKPGT